VKLTIYLHLVLRSRKVGLYLHSHIHLHGIELNYLRTGTTLIFKAEEKWEAKERSIGEVGGKFEKEWHTKLIN
jgi:hypothetical protein